MASNLAGGLSLRGLLFRCRYNCRVVTWPRHLPRGGRCTAASDQRGGGVGYRAPTCQAAGGNKNPRSGWLKVRETGGGLAPSGGWSPHHHQGAVSSLLFVWMLQTTFACRCWAHRSCSILAFALVSSEARVLAAMVADWGTANDEQLSHRCRAECQGPGFQ